MADILKTRDAVPPIELSSRIQKLLGNPVTPIDSLWPIRDAFNKIMPDPRTRNIWTPSVQLIDVQPSENDQEVLVFVTPSRINPRNENEPVLVAKRGYEIKDGPTDYLNMFVRDDTDEIFCKITRWDFENLATQIIDRGKVGKALYAVKGIVPRGDFRMIRIKSIRYIGEIGE
jgi:hypothetical protein